MVLAERGQGDIQSFVVNIQSFVILPLRVVHELLKVFSVPDAPLTTFHLAQSGVVSTDEGPKDRCLGCKAV